ncbi:TVG0629505 [Thermoplasma volcanium GSS1]|uniref:TVG0629505 protein n=1 Tax=Thermoplasma volcanium (strain ATCC 51530 / DSM 4299 / JCM 9571 / NBRC 15438 / GSS1) TaxID=273116 RepID=Q97B22_THEVO|nr:TVG0629505 [Thermoplasma volcanium GSS1]
MVSIPRIPITYIASYGTSISSILSRLDTIVLSVSAVIISILWIPVALEFFSSDESKRISARTRLKNAAIGTFIYIMAVSGILYALVKYIITGS